MRFRCTQTLISILLLGALIGSLAGCSSSNSQAQTEEAQITSQRPSFDLSLEDVSREVPKSPGPVTIEELRAKLSSLEDSSVFEAFGEYKLSDEDEALLNEALAGFKNRNYDASIVMMDLTTGNGVVYQADTTIYSASSIKGVYVASLVAQQPQALQNWYGSIYAILDSSSEEDYHTLRAAFGHDPMVIWCEEAGVDSALGLEWYPYCSSQTLAKLWLQNYAFFQSNAEGVDELIPLYTNTFNSAIHNCLGWQYVVCTKAGWIGEEGYSSTVDAGIVYAGDNPYLLVIMTSAPGDMSMLEPLVVALNQVHDNMCE